MFCRGVVVVVDDDDALCVLGVFVGGGMALNTKCET